MVLATYNNAVIPGEDGKLVQASYEVPASSDVTGEEDTKSEDGYRVHLATSLMSRGARSVLEGVCPDQGHWVVFVLVSAIRGIGVWRLRLGRKLTEAYE